MFTSNVPQSVVLFPEKGINIDKKKKNRALFLIALAMNKK